MKRIVATLCFIALTACSSNEDANNGSNNTIYKQEMRNLVQGISAKAKGINPNFAIIPQNGIELVTTNGDEDGGPDNPYLNAIDGNGQEDLFFGYMNDDEATPAEDNTYLRSLLDISKAHGKTILVTDYCSTSSKMESSYQQNETAGYLSFAAPQRALSIVPPGAPRHENSNSITSLSQAKNFLYLINPENYATKQAFISAVTATNYDVVIMDLFLQNEAFTAAEIEQLHHKANGGRRMLVCYMSIGEAEDYRYYWNDSWAQNPPAWISAENPDWPGNYKVQYWNSEWQDIIYQKSGSYLNKIITAGFDGVYLDIIDAFEYFEGAG